MPESPHLIAATSAPCVGDDANAEDGDGGVFFAVPLRGPTPCRH